MLFVLLLIGLVSGNTIVRLDSLYVTSKPTIYQLTPSFPEINNTHVEDMEFRMSFYPVNANGACNQHYRLIIFTDQRLYDTSIEPSMLLHNLECMRNMASPYNTTYVPSRFRIIYDKVYTPTTIGYVPANQAPVARYSDEYVVLSFNRSDSAISMRKYKMYYCVFGDQEANREDLHIGWQLRFK